MMITMAIVGGAGAAFLFGASIGWMIGHDEGYDSACEEFAKHCSLCKSSLCKKGKLR